MHQEIILKPAIQLGVVPTHLRFVGALVPDAAGRLPRDGSSVLSVVAGMISLCATSPVRLTCVQVPVFFGTQPNDLRELVVELRALGLDIHFIIMVGGADPLNPADEDAVVAQLVSAAKAAVTHGIRHLSSTSIEEWMSARESMTLVAAITQTVKVHQRVYHEAGLEGSCVENWHIEFLRPGEFKIFTSLELGWAFVSAANKALGKPFFRLLVDAAHCGDSGVSLAENEVLIARIAAAGELGIFHASAMTRRGCLASDDGWISALLTAAARTGALRHVFVEVFDHQDLALERLRQLDPRHGVDTRDGRSYTEVVADGLGEVARRLNQLHIRGILP